MSSAGGRPSWQTTVSVRTSIVPPGPRPPPADTPDTSPVVTTSQVTASIHDFAASLALRRSLIAVRESPGIFPVDSSSGRVATHSAADALVWVVRARASMTAHSGARTAHAVRGVASALRQRGDRLTPQGSRRRQEDRPGLAAPALRCVRFHRRGMRHPDAGNRATCGRPGRHTDHPDDVGQGAWHCTVHLVYGVLHGLVLPVWRGDGI
jgi:hypothetical protein